MFTGLSSRTDADLHRQVLAELEFDPAIDAGKIGVAAENGVVTLTGTVGSFAEKWAAEKATKRVRGVHALANEIVVELAGTHQMNDTDIAASAANVIAWDPSIPKSIQVDVSGGHVTLTGIVDWQYQRELVEKHVRHIGGVSGISNCIVLRSLALPTVTKRLMQR